MLVLLSVLQNVLTVNTLSPQSWQKLHSLSVVSVQVHVVNLTLHACVTNREVDVVNVSAVLVLVFLLHHVLFIELAKGVIEVSEYLVEFALDSQVLAVVFYDLVKFVPLLTNSFNVVSLAMPPRFLFNTLVDNLSFSTVIVLFSALILSQLAG